MPITQSIRVRPVLAGIAVLGAALSAGLWAQAPGDTAIPAEGAAPAMAPAAVPSAAAANAGRPNIVVIMGDDVALMDYGVYGGEASTPNIDALAARGAVFTQHRASPLCAPSRAMLLTGMDNHLTGVATIPEVLPPEQEGKPGYSMALEPGVLTLADHLRASGYRTLMSGKWHLGEAPDEMPQAHGFDRSFALAASGADNWDDKSYMAYYKDAPWFEDGVETSLPEDFYSSEFIVDTMIDYLEGSDADKPFLAYLPFQAIHIPVQAPREFIERYDGRYDAGWELLREQRHARAQELGLVPQGSAQADLPDAYRAWDSLSAEDRDLYAARMEVNAAMLEAMDFHIGRFIDHLKAKGQFDNTIFVVTSDNGPEPSRGDNSAVISLWNSLNGYHVGAENMGGPGSWGFIGPEWAVAAATPGAWFKFYATEGGIRTPLIIAGPGIEPAKITSPSMITDIAPTLIEWTGTQPITQDAKPMTGRSLMPVLTGAADGVYAPDDVRAVEVSGNSALYKGDYKITRSVPPAGDGKWRLFNLALDPGETTDLAASEPEIMQDLLAEYSAYTERMGVLEMPEDYNSLETVTANATKRLLGFYPWLWLVPATVVLVPLILIWLIMRAVLKLRRRAQTPA